MSAYQLVIAPAAKKDLRDIYQFGLAQWGQKQTDNYLNGIKDSLALLIEQPLLGVDRAELLPKIRSLPVESHLIFYRLAGEHIEIIRILHGRQDPQRHLK